MDKLKNLFRDLTDAAQSNPAIKDSIEQIKKTMDSGMKSAKEQWEGFGENSTEKYANYIKEALKIIPMLKEVGYETEQFFIHITLSPSIEINLVSIQPMEKERLEQIKERYKENYIFVKTVEALYGASQLQKLIKSDAIEPKGVNILLGVPPKVSLVYKPNY
jgi:hypothetical protein